MTTVDADTLRATFTTRSDLMNKDADTYLCGMALRIARDLFAALPVLKVEVKASQEANTLLDVTFTRAQMNKVRFAFIDPVEFVRECGGVL